MSTPEQRRARRAWIAAHHPDRGGDPHAFATGLAALVGQEQDEPSAPRLTVVRSRRPTRVLRRLARQVTAARRRRTHHGSL